MSNVALQTPQPAPAAPPKPPSLRDFTDAELRRMAIEADAAKDDAAFELLTKELESRKTAAASDAPTKFSRAIEAAQRQLPNIPDGPERQGMEARIARLQELHKAEQQRQAQPPTAAARATSAVMNPILHGMTGGLTDEIAGLTAAGGNPLTGAVRYWTGAPGAEEAYTKGRDAYNAQRKAEHINYITPALEFAGAALPFSRIAQLSTMPARLAASGLAGAAAGAGSAEPGQRDWGAGLGGILGIGGAALGELVTGGLSSLASRFTRPPAVPGVNPAAGAGPGVSATQQAAQAATRPAAEALPGDIPFTLGQRTGDVAQQRLEEGMRAGTKTPYAQDLINQFDLNQTLAIAQHMQALRERMGGVVRDTSEAASSIGAALRDKAAAAKTASQDLFKSAAAKRGYVASDQITDLSTAIQQQLGQTGIHLSPGNYPGSNEAINILRKLPGFEGATAEGPGATITGQALRGIENARQELLKVQPNNPGDVRALTIIRQNFDRWLDKAVDDISFRGDPSALADFKAARALWKEHASIVDPRSPTKTANIIADMAKGNLTPEQIANRLTNYANADAAAEAQKLAIRIRMEFGKDSPEWLQVRQAMASRLLNPGEQLGKEAGAQARISAIDKFLSGDAKSLARTLFTPEEQASLRSVANIYRAVLGDVRAKNVSGSGYVIEDALNRLNNKLSGGGAIAGGTAGFKLGGALGLDPVTSAGISAGLGYVIPSAIQTATGAARRGLQNIQARMATGQQPDLTPAVRGLATGVLGPAAVEQVDRFRRGDQ